MLALLVALAACGEDAPTEPPEPVLADYLGVPKGADLFRSEKDAEEFDGHVARFVLQECRTLEASIAALRGRDDSPLPTGRRLVNVGTALIPGPVGNVSRAIDSDLTRAAAARGNLRLAAAEAVKVAKDC